MKRLMTIMVAITMIFASCSKERKFNKSLEGDWNVVTIDGKGLDAGDVMTFTFNDHLKKDDGTLTITKFEGATYWLFGMRESYILNKDKEIVMTKPFWFNPTIDKLIIQSYSKTDMILKSSPGEVYVLKKK